MACWAHGADRACGVLQGLHLKGRSSIPRKGVLSRSLGQLLGSIVVYVLCSEGFTVLYESYLFVAKA